MTPIVVGLGGALGAIARYYGTDWVRAVLGDAFPWGTLLVNVTGSFAIGFVLVLLHTSAPATQFRQFIVIGLLGSFTTFSTFSYEAVALFRSGEVLRGSGYIAGSVFAGLVAVLLGAALAGALAELRG